MNLQITHWVSIRDVVIILRYVNIDGDDDDDGFLLYFKS